MQLTPGRLLAGVQPGLLGDSHRIRETARQTRDLPIRRSRPCASAQPSEAKCLQSVKVEQSHGNWHREVVQRLEGFRQDGGGEDVFCHQSAIQATGFRSLAEGQKVEFDVKQGPKGLQADNVRVVA